MGTSDFQDIVDGLNDAIAHAQGDVTGMIEHQVKVPAVDVAAIRLKMEMSQTEFAAAFGVSVGTVRNWEQGRRSPRGPARVLLNIISREPDAVRRVLEDLAA